MNDNEIMNARSMILQVTSNLQAKMKMGDKIVKLWQQIVESIKSNSINGDNIGKNMASHSRVNDFENGILLIECDHPGWIQMLQTHKKYILKGFELKAPEMKIQSLAFKLSGTTAGLRKVKEQDQIDKQNRIQNERMEQEEKILEEKGFTYQKPAQKKELPPEIQKMFDEMKDDMLTKNK